MPANWSLDWCPVCGLSGKPLHWSGCPEQLAQRKRLDDYEAAWASISDWFDMESP